MAALDNLKESVIVVAHPDDEILWFSSLLEKVAHIVFCFSDEMADPSFGARRKKVIAEYPLKNSSTLGLTSLGIPRPKSFVRPRFNKYGITIVGSDQHVLAHQKKYKQNYYDLRKKLASILSQYRKVFTHNPWGEYGHEEHVQVHRAVCELQDKMGYEIWYPSYCSTRTLDLIDPRWCLTENVTLQTNAETAERLMEIYERNGCWTWHQGWQWPLTETFFQRRIASPYDVDNGKLVSLNLLVLPLVSQESSGLCRSAYRRLKSLVKNALRKVS